MSNFQITKEDVQNAIANETAKLKSSYSSKEQVQLLGASWFKCAACKSGLTVSLAAVIAAAIAGFPEDMPLIAMIAKACGISIQTVTDILSKGPKGVEDVIQKLCKAMNACD